MKRRFALWLAEVTDRWARTVADDDGPERLAATEAYIDVWEIDHGDFIDRTCAPVVYLDEHTRRRHARRQHPAGTAL